MTKEINWVKPVSEMVADTIMMVLYSLMIMWLWNSNVAPLIEGAPQIDFWQALSVKLIARFLLHNHITKTVRVEK